MKLGPSQQAVYDLLHKAAEDGRSCPTNNEICDMLGATSPATSVRAMSLLVNKGLIEVTRYRASRSVKIVETGKITGSHNGDETPHWRLRDGGVTTPRSGVIPQKKPTASKLQPYHKTAMAPQRDTSRAGMAADWLRRFGPLKRCDAAGRFDPKGDHWVRGSTLLTAAEVIDRAERNGWQPDAWKSLPPRVADAA